MASPEAIRTIDMQLIEEVFEMGGGYVLDFTDRTFAEFFEAEVGIDIDNPCFQAEGTSKAKRLRRFLKISSRDLRVRALTALWEYREAQRRRKRIEENFPDAEQEFVSLLRRLSGSPARSTQEAVPPSPQVRTDPMLLNRLKGDLLAVGKLPPHARGYAFERFLAELWRAYCLAPRGAFRIVGEQIDGSFEMGGQVYLLEAKWQATSVGAADLRAFNGKVEEKAAWSRGLFVSHSGFSEDGLAAFGRGKRVVCMDGLDLFDMLDRGLPFSDVLA